MTKKIVYAANPMCSWCYGFSPVISEVRERFQDRVDSIELVLGDLQHGEMNPHLVDYLKDCWTSVNERTGAEFNYDFFQREGFVYDSKPSTRAIYIAKELKPNADFEMFNRIQRAFYAENQDITDIDTLVRLAAEEGIDSDVFSERIRDESEIEAMTQDSIELEQSGLRSYPTLLFIDDNKIIPNLGYIPIEPLSEFIDNWIEDRLSCPKEFEEPSVFQMLREIASHYSLRARLGVWRIKKQRRLKKR